MNTLTREQRHTALATARLDDWADPWGTTMTHWFAIADILYHAGATLPAEWQYQHGAYDHDPIAEYIAHQAEQEGECMCQWPDTEYVPFLDAGELGIQMLTYAGQVLDRYARRLSASQWLPGLCLPDHDA